MNLKTKELLFKHWLMFDREELTPRSIEELEKIEVVCLHCQDKYLLVDYKVEPGLPIFFVCPGCGASLLDAYDYRTDFAKYQYELGQEYRSNCNNKR